MLKVAVVFVALLVLVTANNWKGSYGGGGYNMRNRGYNNFNGGGYIGGYNGGNNRGYNRGYNMGGFNGGYNMGGLNRGGYNMGGGYNFNNGRRNLVGGIGGCGPGGCGGAIGGISNGCGPRGCGSIGGIAGGYRPRRPSKKYRY